jgi:hypothetical protein
MLFEDEAWLFWKDIPLLVTNITKILQRNLDLVAMVQF